MSNALQTTIDQAWEQRAELSAASAPAEVRDAVNHIIDQLDTGKIRVAEKINGAWEVHQWVKKAVLLSFRLNDNVPMGDGALQFYDKVPTKYAGMSAEQLKATGRVAWASAACWNPCRPTPPSSKTTASSAPARKSSKA